MRISDWSSDVCSSDLRAKAIRELESMAIDNGTVGTAAVEEICGDQATVNQLAEFINSTIDGFHEGDTLLCRFGYVVGLVTSCVKPDSAGEGRLNRFLRNIVYKTGLVTRKAIDPHPPHQQEP